MTIINKRFTRNYILQLTYQPTLYKLSQLIASSIVPDLKPDEKEEATHLQKWADRVVLGL